MAYRFRLSENHSNILNFCYRDFLTRVTEPENLEG
jgi:hypothetical protein